MNILKKTFYFLASGLCLTVFSFFLIHQPCQAQQQSDVYKTYEADSKLVLKAISEKNTSYCAQLKGLSKDDCIYAVASSSDFSVCQQITNQDYKKLCQQDGLSRQAIANNNINDCLPLTIEDKKKDCLTAIFRTQTDYSLCDSMTGYEILCRDTITYKLALANSKQILCDKIIDAKTKQECQTSFNNLPADSDSDGLIDTQERLIGTDPNNADTDGDGIPDLQELKQGTNPLVKEEAKNPVVAPKLQIGLNFFAKNWIIILIFAIVIILLVTTYLLFKRKKNIKF